MVSSAAHAAKWKTPEYLCYFGIVIVAVASMAATMISFCDSQNIAYESYKHKLSPGWIFGRKVDNSDHQYATFRDGFLSLSGLALVFLLIRRLSSNVFLLLALSLTILVVLHGISTLKLFIIVYTNYFFAKKFSSHSHSKVLIWIINLGFLFANDYYDGYHFGNIHSSLSLLDNSHLIQGLIPRWHITFNISMLRLLSFSLDYIDAIKKPAAEKEKIDLSHFNFCTYLCYLFYTPLYIAGPIMSFSSFVEQINNPPDISWKSIGKYFGRFIICLMTMEFILHYMYVVAIKDIGHEAWNGATPFQLGMIGFWNLIIVWLKLLIPWRFFRLWALLDGIDPPENMIRCMANNYSTLGFWRGWHVSYNKWIVKYIYVPLGGKQRPIIATLVVFTFVALWHDLSFRLLIWGWVITLFILPELLAGRLFPESKYGNRKWYLHLCAFGAVLNIIMMMIGNLIGFVTGIDGMKQILSDFVSQETNPDGSSKWFSLYSFIVLVFVSCFSAVKLMIEYRQEEMRNGIYRRC